MATDTQQAPATQAKITSLDPASGPQADFRLEQSVGECRIKGSGFGAKQGTGFVTFGGKKAAVRSWNDTEILVSIPWQLKPLDIGNGQFDHNRDVVVVTDQSRSRVTTTYRVE